MKCKGNPDLYIITKRKGNRIAVGAWNCFYDTVIAPEFVMPGTVKNVKFVNTDGVYKDNTVTTNDIPPFSLCCFEADI